MQNTNRNLAVVFILALMVGGAAFLLYRAQTSAPLTATSDQANATTTAAPNAAATAGNTNGGTTVVLGSSIQDMVIAARAQKDAGNYQASITTLLKAAALAPGDVVVNNNLGDLYMFFAKDYVKAEAAYKKVIATDPRLLDGYRHLLELYTTTSYKPTNTAAADVVAKALVTLPNAYDLQVILARWYRDTRNYTEAKATYQAAIANAKGQNFTSVAADIQAELSALPQ